MKTTTIPLVDKLDLAKMSAAARMTVVLVCLMAAVLPGSSVAQDSVQFRYAKQLPNNAISPLTATDEEGNLYVFGRGLNNDTIEGQNLFELWMDSSLAWPVGAYSNLSHAIYLIKYDPTGRMLWKKVATHFTPANANGEKMECSPMDLVVHDSTVSIVMGYEPYSPNYDPDTWLPRLYGTWFYLFDTVIRDTMITSADTVPYLFNRGWLDFFVDFDMDGNIKELHTLRIVTQETLVFGPSSELSGPGYWKVAFDSEGNRHLFCTMANITPWDTTKTPHHGLIYDYYCPPYIIIDGDTKQPYDLGFEERYVSWEHQSSINLYLKIDPNWNILKHKMMVDHLTGPGLDTINEMARLVYLDIKDIAVNDSDNIYLVGQFSRPGLPHAIPHSNETWGLPIRLFLDSVHYFRIANPVECKGLADDIGAAFLIKYDTAGNVIWCNQQYGDDNCQYHRFFIPSNIVLDSGMVLVAGKTYFLPSPVYDYIYFDSAHTIQVRKLSWPTYTEASFIAAYSQQTGEFDHYCFADTINQTRYDTYNTKRNLAPGLAMLRYAPPVPNTNYQKTVYGFGANDCSYEDKGWNVYGDVSATDMIVHHNGLLYRGFRGSYSSRTLYGDGFSLTSAYDDDDGRRYHFILCQYVPELDRRRDDCPAVESLAMIHGSGQEATVAWRHNPAHTRWQLELAADSADWGGAVRVEVTDTVYTLSVDDCRWCRVRGFCSEEVCGPWSGMVQVCPSEGIDPVAPTALILVPNPARGGVTVRVAEPLTGILTVADASGREVLSRELKGEATPVTLDIAALPSGVYFVTLRTEKYTATRKLVVEN